jgi:glycosyltransferase involved in cell wall biosynthesis
MVSTLPCKIFVNGRFLRGPITGTARVAEEILSQWDACLAADRELGQRFEIILLRPRQRVRDMLLKHIRQVDVHWLGGKLWELVDLPLAARSGWLLNFANITPFAHPRSIVYLHDAQIFLYPQSYPPRERLLHQLLVRLGGRTARRIITISEFSADMLARYGVADRAKMRVINNGADHILRAPADETVLTRFGLEPRSYVLMFGSGFPYKNTKVVYEAMKLLGHQAPRLAVIGRADERRRLDEIIDSGTSRVTLVHDLSDGALRALYANALVFAAPSRTEGYPITPLEALNCGCPVITTPEGSMPEVLAGAVDYAHADSADDWAKAIMAYMGDADRRAAALARGAPLAASKTWALAAKQLLQEVEDLSGIETRAPNA